MKKRKRIASQRTKVNGETYISSARVEMVVTEIRKSAPCQLFVSMFSGMDCEHTHTRKHYIQFQQFHNFAAIGIASVAQCEQTAAAAQKIGENGNKKKLKFVPSSVRYHYSQSGASIEQFRFFFFRFSIWRVGARRKVFAIIVFSCTSFSNPIPSVGSGCGVCAALPAPGTRSRHRASRRVIYFYLNAQLHTHTRHKHVSPSRTYDRTKFVPVPNEENRCRRYSRCHARAWRKIFRFGTRPIYVLR